MSVRTVRKADVVIYNTCTVRENANLKVYGRLGHLHSLKDPESDMKIILFGCMMQEPQVVEKIKNLFFCKSGVWNPQYF